MECARHILDDERLDALLDAYELHEPTIAKLELQLEEDLGLKPRLRRPKSASSLTELSTSWQVEPAHKFSPAWSFTRWHQYGSASHDPMLMSSQSGMDSIFNRPKSYSASALMRSVSSTGSESQLQPFRKTRHLDPKQGAEHEPGPTHFFKPSCIGWSPHPHKFKDTTIGTIYRPRQANSCSALASTSKRATTGCANPPRPGFRKTIGLDPKPDAEHEPGPTHFCRASCIGWQPYPHKYRDTTIGVLFRPPCRKLSESGNWAYSKRLEMAT